MPQHHGAGSASSRRRPLTIPTGLETRDGVEWLAFTYTSRGQSTPYAMRIDIDSVDASADLSDEFKAVNAVYPRANVPQHEYAGNRWQYESTVNEIGWRLAFLNNELVGKRGLLQRAVDSFRNRFPYMKSRRVARVEKHDNSIAASSSVPRITTTNTSDDTHVEDKDNTAFGEDGVDAGAGRRRRRTSMRDTLMPVLPPREAPALVEALMAKPSNPSHHPHRDALYHHGNGSVHDHVVQTDRSTSRIDTGIEWTYDKVTGEPMRKRPRRNTANGGSHRVEDTDTDHATSLPSSSIDNDTETTQSQPSMFMTIDTVHDHKPVRFQICIDFSSITQPPSLDYRQRCRLFDTESIHTAIDTTNTSSSTMLSNMTTNQQNRHDTHMKHNDIAWKLAMLNPTTCGVSRNLLQRAVDVYLQRFGDDVGLSRPGKRRVWGLLIPDSSI